MIATTGFFQDYKGNNSSTRLIGTLVIIYSLVLVTGVLVVSILQHGAIMMAAAAAGTLFTSIAGPVMFWMFGNKQKELSTMVSEQNTVVSQST